MRSPGSDLAFRLCQGLFSSLLALYPAGFRAQYGHSMEMHFRDLCRESVRRHRRLAALAALLSVLPDLILSAAREHWEGMMDQPDGASMRRDRARILLVAGLPLGLALGGVLVNPAYMAQLVVPSEAQPVGWMLAASVVGLTTLGFLAQLRIACLAHSTPTGSVLVDSQAPVETQGAAQAGHPGLGRWGRGLLFTLAFLLTTLPATLLVLLGPSAVVLLRSGLWP